MTVKSILLILGINLFISFNIKSKSGIKFKDEIFYANFIDSNKAHISFEKRPLKDNYFFKYRELTEKTYKIIWGIKGKKEFISKMTFEYLGTGNLKYLTSNDSAIFFSQNCGISCRQLVMFPLSGKSEKIYYFPLAIDLNDNLIAYCLDTIDDNAINICIENYLSSNQSIYHERDACSSILKNECIKNSYFENGYLYVTWYGSKWTITGNDDLKSKKYNLKHHD